MLDHLRVDPGDRARLHDRDTRAELDLHDRDAASAEVARLTERLGVLQNRLYAEGSRSLLVVLQGMDTAGKDGTIRQVFAGVNPQGCRVASFKAPVGAELAHDYLWRVHAVCPARGEIGVFNRSHYEDIVAVRTHDLVPAERWKRRYRHICEFERLLVDEGTTVVKVFLHISKDEQRERLQARLDDPEKRWKFRLGDLDDRAKWHQFQEAYEDVLSETSTEWAPWYVVPADRKWVRDVAVSRLLVGVLEDLGPQIPAPKEDLSGVTVP